MSTVPGSLFRKILFWSHLACGVVAGVFILMMSVTGVALTYERQMLASAAERNHVSVPVGQAPLDADALAAAATALDPGNARLPLVFEATPGAPVSVGSGRQLAALLNPLTGQGITDESTGMRGFMSAMRSWHRYLGADSDSIGAQLIDYSNLLFVFITLSGLYLWLPAVWRWRTVRGLALFQRRYVNAKVRDFNWHHVFGLWMLVPLFLIALSGAVISFPWAGNLVYAAFGEQAPQRGGGGGGPGGGGAGQGNAGGPRPEAAVSTAGSRASLQQLFDATARAAPDWQRITLPMQAQGDHVEVQVELKSTERRAPRRTVELSVLDASLTAGQETSSQPAVQTRGQRARSWFRFVHTGEEYGVVGQTIAGLASLAACFLVYTGLALAWRRLIRPLWRVPARTSPSA
jgi:uncharacterized iron-regulated membrane protein